MIATDTSGDSSGNASGPVFPPPPPVAAEEEIVSMPPMRSVVRLGMEYILSQKVRAPICRGLIDGSALEIPTSHHLPPQLQLSAMRLTPKQSA